MFQNREAAATVLSDKLASYAKSSSAVLAIVRGGVVIGKIISSQLNIPLSIIVVRKIGAPNNPELAIGAIAQGGITVIDQHLTDQLGVNKGYLTSEIKKLRRAIRERAKLFKIKHKFSFKDYNNVILTDDGVATGATVEAAIKYIRQQARGNRQKAQIILAVPVIAKDTYHRLKSMVREIVALEIADLFGAVGEFYREFRQVSDEEVIKLLAGSS